MTLLKRRLVTEHRGGSVFIIWAVAALGMTLRILSALRGHNFDVDSYRIVADIVASGGNVYAETHRYNYGPIWFHVLHFLDWIPSFGADDLESLRIKVAGFLAIVDLCIYLFLLNRYSFLAASLFFLNPISIIITGYHSQFDNLAVLLALVTIAGYSEKGSLVSRFACLIGIGLSLCVKHILFAFPLWLAFKERAWSKKLVVLLVPYSVFVLGFLFYAPDGLQGIIKNVFLYRSFDNAPFWAIFSPNIIFFLVPKIVLFIGALVLVGLWTRERPPLESLHVYLLSLVVFSSAIANQYLSIPIPSIAVFWNWGYALYSAFGCLYLIVDENGLHIVFVANILNWTGKHGYYLLIFLLTIGLSITLFGKQKVSSICNYFVVAIQFLLNQVRTQLRAPWY